ncbi:MAG TPA: hypothetical protein VE056_03235, partial [Pyrinomonadaceae bacterium]|nr:hypothetical protein [Pyrinomonadaceae bacterium]
MRVFNLSRTLLVIVCVGLCWTNAPAQTGTDAPLTNTAVVKLVKANFKEKTIIAIIGSRATRFDLSTERMIELKRTGVTERIILAMLARQQGMDFDARWNDDAFFNPGNDNLKIDKPDDPSRNSSSPDNSTDIFGSSAGSRG